MDRVEELIERISQIDGEIRDYKARYGVDQVMKDMGHEFDNLCEELARTNDMRGLLYLLDYFDVEFDLEYEGVLQVIENDIFDNYSYTEIIEALYEKFDKLLNKHIEKVVRFVIPFFEELEDFERFRKMFNEVRASKSEEFLDKLLEIFSKESFRNYYEYGIDWINLLREDMKK